MESAEAFSAAKHRAKYAHKDALVWRSADGWLAADYCAASLRAAMLATGTGGHFSKVGAKVTARIGWRQAVRMLRSFAAMGISQ